MLKEKFETEAMESDAVKSASFVRTWLAEIESAQKREKAFRKTGRAVVKLYEAEDKAENSFNVLYSNTETLAPALYNSVPRPVVKRRFNDTDSSARAASELCQRTLSYLIDSDVREYATFDELLQSAVLSALVPGRGVTRFKYEADFASVEAVEDVEAGEGASAETTPEPPEGAVPESGAYETVSSEYVCGEIIPWDRLTYGYAKTWDELPWLAIEHFMGAEELERNFGKELAKEVELVEVSPGSGGEESETGSKASEGSAKLGHVYDFWDKVHKTVVFLSPGYRNAPLRSVPDPLGLAGFFPVPKPLMLTQRINSIIPNAPYVFYEEQAKELNRITQRINKLVAALKVRGFYDSTLAGIDKVLSAGDNELIPVENAAALQQGMTLDKALSLMPIEKLITVLQQLYLQRNQVKQVIYEITGIADIMRGSSAASETLGAQQIKNQWGTLRLKRSQREVARYSRDCLRIMAEIAVTKFSPETLKAMTNMPLPLAAEKQQAQALLQQLSSSGVPPEQLQQVAPQMAEIQQMLAQPSIDELQAMLKNDTMRSYRVEIETNSTVDLEATEDKKDTAELMNAIAQFLNGVAPAVEKGILPFEAAKGMLLGIVRKFRFGADIEETLQKMQPPPPPKEPEKPAGADPAVTAAKTQASLASENAKQETIQMNLEASRAEHTFKMEELNRKAQLAVAQHGMKMQAARMKTSGVTA